MDTPPRDVLIFWDFENCRPSSNASGLHIADSIRNIAHKYGTVKSFRAYLEITDGAILNSPKAINLRSQLQSSGVSLVDCPHNGSKNVADIMMIVDMMAAALDCAHDTTTFLVITGDKDFTYPLAVLRLRGYPVVLMHTDQATPGLRSRATVCYDWSTDVLEKAPSDTSVTESSKGRPRSRRPSMAATYSFPNGPSKHQHEASSSVLDHNRSSTAGSNYLTEWEHCKATATSAHRGSVGNVERPPFFALTSSPQLSLAAIKQPPSLVFGSVNGTDASCSASTPPPKHAPSNSQALPSFTWGKGTPRSQRTEVDRVSGPQPEPTTQEATEPEPISDQAEGIVASNPPLPGGEPETIKIHQPAPSLPPASLEVAPGQTFMSVNAPEDNAKPEDATVTSLPPPATMLVSGMPQVRLPQSPSPAAVRSAVLSPTLLPPLSLCAAVERTSSVISISTSSDVCSPVTDDATTAFDLSRPGTVVPSAISNRSSATSPPSHDGDSMLWKGKEREVSQQPGGGTSDPAKLGGLPVSPSPQGSQLSSYLLNGPPGWNLPARAASGLQPLGTPPQTMSITTLPSHRSPPSSNDLWLQNALNNGSAPFQPSAATLNALKQLSPVATSPPSGPSYPVVVSTPDYHIPSPAMPAAVASASTQLCRPIPPGMAPLITVLEKFAYQGEHRPALLKVQAELALQNPSILSPPGGLGFKDWPAYFSKSEVHRIARMDKDPKTGVRWITINDGWKTMYRDDRAAQAGGSGGSVSDVLGAKSSFSSNTYSANTSPTAATVTPIAHAAPSKPSPHLFPLPAYFKPLIQALETNQSAYPERRVLRTHAAVETVKLDSAVYRKAGVETFAQFSALAKVAGIVDLGSVAGMPGHEWIRLLDWSQKYRGDLGDAGDSPAVIKPTSSQYAPCPTKKNPEHEKFRPLITVLQGFQSQGIKKPSRVVLGPKLNEGQYKKVGATKLKGYLPLAESAGVVTLGGSGSDCWVSLRPWIV